MNREQLDAMAAESMLEAIALIANHPVPRDPTLYIPPSLEETAVMLLAKKLNNPRTVPQSPPETPANPNRHERRRRDSISRKRGRR